MAAKRTRRSASVIRALMLNAARQAFAEKGYAGAVTRDIAARAEVSEVLLFRHFQSKAQLFEEAVFDPMDQYIRQFQEQHMSRGIASPGSLDESRDFVAGLHTLLTRNRRQLMALIAAEAFEDEVSKSLKQSPALKDYFEAAGSYMSAGHEDARPQMDLAVRLSFATALAVSLFQEWLLGDAGERMASKQLIDQVTTFVLGGIGALVPVAVQQPQPPATAAPEAAPRKARSPKRSEPPAATAGAARRKNKT